MLVLKWSVRDPVACFYGILIRLIMGALIAVLRVNREEHTDLLANK